MYLVLQFNALESKFYFYETLSEDVNILNMNKFKQNRKYRIQNLHFCLETNNRN